MNHPEIIRLVIAYTFIGVIVFTAIITCLSLIGVVKLADPRQQRKLFNILIIELLVGSITLVFDFLSLNVKEVAKTISENAVENTAIPIAKKIINEVLESRSVGSDSSKLVNKSNRKVNFSGRVVDNGIASLQLMLDNTIIPVNHNTNDNQKTFSIEVDADGVHTFYYLVTGFAGVVYSIEVTSPTSAAITIQKEIGRDGHDAGGFSFEP